MNPDLSSLDRLEAALTETSNALAAHEDAETHAQLVRDLGLRARKLRRASARKQALGLFGPSQAGKSFLVGALLSHELGSLEVAARTRGVDFLREVNPAKGVESTGVVTRFSTSAAASPTRGDFFCELLSLEGVLSSMATGFLVECTAPPLDVDRAERALREARLEVGPAASPLYAAAWDAVWHELGKKYQDRHPYLNELRRHPLLRSGKPLGVTSQPGWLKVFALLWGGSGYAVDLDRLMHLLVTGLESLGHAERVEVGLEHVRASSTAPSIIDASCLNALGENQAPVTVWTSEAREASLDPGVLAALIAEIRLPLRSGAPGSLLDKADILDFPGGRALKGINGFAAGDLASGRLTNAIEVYKRGKLTFLFEQYAQDRDITALLLCSPGPNKPEAIQLQSQVESWLAIRHGSATPTDHREIEEPSIFLALTKFDMSLGALRSDNARDRWDSRVEQACIDFWARGQDSWLRNWGTKGKPFTNLFWIRNPHADQMNALGPGDADYEAVKQGYLASRAVTSYVAEPEMKWQAVEGKDERGLPRSGVPLLASQLRQKLDEDIKGRELGAEARTLRTELMSVLTALTPSRDEAEERARRIEDARALATALDEEVRRRCSGAVFGEFIDRVVVPESELEGEVRKVLDAVSPMSIKASDKVKKLLVHVLKWWSKAAAMRLRESTLGLPQAPAEAFVREVCTSKQLLPILGQAIFPYFARTTVDAALVANIVRVKVCDAMLGLFRAEPRRTPAVPIRLSYAEEHAADGDGGGIDWTNVDFSDEATAAPASSVSIVFAGNRYYDRWGERLEAFYLTGGGTRGTPLEDARVAKLQAIRRNLEQFASLRPAASGQGASTTAPRDVFR